MPNLDSSNSHIEGLDGTDPKEIMNKNIFNGLSDDVLDNLSQDEHYIDIGDCDFDGAVELLLEEKKKDPNCFIIFGYHKIDANTREEAYLQYFGLTPEQFNEAIRVYNN